MTHPAGAAIALDTGGESWTGVFPGLGSVTVSADGSITVQPDESTTDSADTVERRSAALTYGWGEPLSWARRGFLLLHGGCVTPDAASGALLVTGDLHEFGRLLPALSDLGCSFLSDRYTPAQWVHGDLMAHPVAAPILLSARRAKKAGWDGRPVRGDTDTLAVDVARTTEPVRIRAVVQVHRARPDDQPLQPLSGHHRFEVAASLCFGGVLSGHANQADQDTDTDPAEVMAEHLRLSALPMARLSLSGDGEQLPDEADQLVQWWGTTVQADR